MIGTLSRRRLLGMGATGLVLAAGLKPPRAAGSTFSPSPAPFSLGVASGDPTDQSVVLWTRLASDPLDGGGMPNVPIAVKWQVATDPEMRHVVRSGVALAWPALAHTVHVHVRGLAADRWYWYRFEAGGEQSPLGRTRTFPAPDGTPRQMKLAFVSCQHFEHGFYTAYEHLAEEDLDFVIHLGDYIYEDAASPGRVRQHVGDEAMSLADYRNRYAQYKGDPNLQAAHARFPFIVTWDDHEVENNYAGLVSEDNDIRGAAPVPPDVFRQRRAAAYRAFFEHMPLGRRTALVGAHALLFRRFRFGRLAELSVLDTRQFRSNQPCGGVFDQIPPSGDDVSLACGEERNPAATMMGTPQEAWLLGGLVSSHARWNVIAQQVMMARLNFAPGPSLPAAVLNMDSWDGYATARNRLLGFVDQRDIRNVVVLSGDAHVAFAADLHADFEAPGSPVATEFVGTSISSDFAPEDFAPEAIAAIQAALLHPSNGHIKFFNGALRGYVRCEVDEERWRADFRAVATVAAPTSAVQTLASFEIRDGVPGAIPSEPAASPRSHTR
jgi:alkaline phosphatase D